GWNPPREEASLRRAISLAPQWAPPYSWLGLMLSAIPGRSEEAIAMARRSVELEPLSANAQTNVGLAVFSTRRFEEADAEFRRALSLDPNGLYPLWTFAVNCRRLGKHEEAVAAVEHAAELTKRRQSFYLGMLGGAYAAAGNPSGAREVLAEMKALSSREYVPPFHFAFVYVPLRDLDLAIDSIEKGIEERNAFVWWIRDYPTWDGLREHPRFPQVLEKIVPA